MTYKFAGLNFRNSDDYHDAIAGAWLYTEGSRQAMQEVLVNWTDVQLAAGVVEITGWSTLIENQGFSQEALIEAFGRLRRDFDERFPNAP